MGDRSTKALAKRLESASRNKWPGRYAIKSGFEGAARFKGNAWEKAARWRMVEVLVAQDMRRAQLELPFVVLTEEEFEDRSSRIVEAAEHFLRTEVNAPQYFGRNAIADVSSSNVNQYLEVAGELFEEVMAKFSGPRNQSSPLTTERQDAIIRESRQTALGWTCAHDAARCRSAPVFAGFREVQHPTDIQTDSALCARRNRVRIDDG